MTAVRAAGVLTVAVLLIAAGTTDVKGQMFVSTGRDTLRGLPGVEVIVEGLQPELERSGLTAAAIRADVERRLRDGGIVVYASQTANSSLAKAYLYVHLNALVLPQDGYAVAVQLHLRQTLRSLVTGSNVVNAMTWDAQNVLGVPGAAVQTTVRTEVLAFVDQFVQDWAAVH